MSVKLLPEHHLEFLSLKGSCTGSSESTLVKLPQCYNKNDYATSNVLDKPKNHRANVGFCVDSLQKDLCASSCADTYPNQKGINLCQRNAKKIIFAK